MNAIAELSEEDKKVLAELFGYRDLCIEFDDENNIATVRKNGEIQTKMTYNQVISAIHLFS